MRAVRFLVLGAMACALAVGAMADDKKEPGDKAKLIVGKWELTKSSEKLPPIGTVYEFNKDGTLKIIAKINGKETILNGDYTVDGDKFRLTLKVRNKKEEKLPMTIKKITENEMIMEGKGPGNQGDAAFEFKRIK